MLLITTFIATALATLLVSCTPPAGESDPIPLQSRQPVVSMYGFSFLPPQGENWVERFGQDQFESLKQTDTRTVSFYAGAISGKLRSKLSTKEQLVAFVRSKKDTWGDEGRYSNTSSRFQIEDDNDSCVRYRLSAYDRGAVNKGPHEFLIMLTAGRFCVQPQTKGAAVDIYYSIRHVPQFDPKELVAEGEEFLQGMQFSASP